MNGLDLEFWKGASRRLLEVFSEAESRLCGYDGAIGDGDHGTSMLYGWTQADRRLSEQPPADVGQLLRQTGQAFLGNVGGVTGFVFGSLFTGAGDGASGAQELDTAGLHRAFAAGLSAVKERANVKEGDKSMVDALAPAVTALAQAAGEGRQPAEALRLASRAAAAGLEATRSMEARVGRARYQGAKALGHVDAGAASIVLIFETLASWVAGH
jgi:dihydroxyacetone kinase-like protein